MIVESIQTMRGSSESIVTLTDGVSKCKCFCQPCELADGDHVSGPLFGFGAGEIRRVATIQGRIVQNARLPTEVTGMVVSTTPAIVAVGGIQIESESSMPKDLKIGEFVEFTCERLDLLD